MIGAPDPAQRTVVAEPATAWITATRVGVAASILAHATLIGILIAKLEWGGPFTPVPTTIPVDLVPDPTVKDPEKDQKPTTPQPTPDAASQQQRPPSPAPGDATPAPRGVPKPPPPAAGTTIVDATASPSDLDALEAQVLACWTIPTGWTNPKEVSVTIGFHLNADGTVTGPPAIIEFPATLVGKAAADSALRAVTKCGPYHLPSGKDKGGRDVQVRLSPPS